MTDTDRLRVACADGTHDVARERRPGDGHTRTGPRACVICGLSAQTLSDHLGHVENGAFRVVCRDPGCGYGENRDRRGNGYTNHLHLFLAQAAIRDHQPDEGMHDAQIEQHPCPAVIGEGET